MVRFNAILTWLVANLVIGFAASVPLLTAIPLASFVWQPPTRSGYDLPLAVTIFLIGTSSLTAVAVFANRALHRQLAATRRHTVVFSLATVALLFFPTAYFLVTKP
jgi:hypothetical protein